MSRHVRTTVRLPDALMAQARREAQRRGETLTALIERGVRHEIAHPPAAPARRKVDLPVSPCRGGARPGIDLTNSAALWDIMDGNE